MIDLSLDGPFLRWDGKFVVLSLVQTDIMKVFLRHPNKLLTMQALKSLSRRGGSDELMRVHIGLLRRVLGEPKGNPRLIRTVHSRQGYMLVTDEKLGELLDRKYDGLGRLK